MSATDYGSSTYGICICTAINSSGANAYPSAAVGQYRWFILTDKIGGPLDFCLKMKILPLGNSYEPGNGSMNQKITMSDCLLIDGATIVNLIQLFRTRRYNRSGKVFLFIKNLSAAGEPDWTDKDNLFNICTNTSGAALSYLPCLVSTIDWEMSDGNFIRSIKLEECQT